MKDTPLKYYKEDPVDIPELLTVFSTAQEQEELATESIEMSAVFRKEVDCFAALPQEILEEIQLLLQSNDVTSLRLSSRSFASVPLNQYFWASRFEPRFDRGFLFEARDMNVRLGTAQTHRDWGALYRKTSKSACLSKGLENRMRIWNCTLSLAKLLVTAPSPNKGLLPTGRNLLLCYAPKEDSGWRVVGGELTSTSHGIPAEILCRDLFEQTISIPSRLSVVAVSILRFGDKLYVSGIRFVSCGGPKVRLGHILPGKETMLNITGTGGTESSLGGFILAVGPRGVQALRATTTEGYESEWAGCPDGLPQTLRLRTEQCITGLKGGFDVYFPFPRNYSIRFPFFFSLLLTTQYRLSKWFP
jgi:U3 small nucleolar RNA-associated protein 4